MFHRLVYVSNPSRSTANTAGVFHLRSPEGKYKMNLSEAGAACQAEGATLATFKQLGDAQQVNLLSGGFHRDTIRKYNFNLCSITSVHFACTAASVLFICLAFYFHFFHLGSPGKRDGSSQGVYPVNK